MRVEATAIYRCGGYSGPVPRIESPSPVRLRGAASRDEDASPAPAGSVDVQTNVDGDTVEISPQGSQAALVLDSQEQQVVAQLKAIDQEIRAHEMAHLAAAGPYARGGASYQYTKGPDGVQYAVAGEVPIDVSPEPGDPQATIRKAEVVRAAALAPADPSGQDRQVAAAATKMEAEARQELSSEQAVSLASQSASSKAAAQSAKSS